MPVKSLKTEIIDKRPNAKPQANAKIKNVDGSTFTEVSDTAFDRDDAKSTQKINQSTGYFGTKVS